VASGDVQLGKEALEKIAFTPAEAGRRPTIGIERRALIFTRDHFVCISKTSL
jgi:hypothetical protein